MKQNKELEETLATIIAYFIGALYVIVLLIASLKHMPYGFVMSAGIIYFMFFGKHTKENG